MDRNMMLRKGRQKRRRAAMGVGLRFLTAGVIVFVIGAMPEILASIIL